jgi:hypothetical protein
LYANAEKADPEWLMNVISPPEGSFGIAKPHTSRDRAGCRKPMQLPPQIDMRASVAMRARRSVRVGAPGLTSS